MSLGIKEVEMEMDDSLSLLVAGTIFAASEYQCSAGLKVLVPVWRRVYLPRDMIKFPYN